VTDLASPSSIDFDPVTYEAGWDSTAGTQAALLTGIVDAWWLFIGGAFQILFGGMYLGTRQAAQIHAPEQCVVQPRVCARRGDDAHDRAWLPQAPTVDVLGSVALLRFHRCACRRRAGAMGGGDPDHSLALTLLSITSTHDCRRLPCCSSTSSAASW
jgi:hypothetical protein